MFCIDDMKSCIQEWFGEALTPVEVAKTYHIVAGEAEKQLDYVMEQITKNDENQELAEDEMERLTTKNDMGIAVLKQPYRCERCGEETWSLSDHGNREPIDKLAEYEDLEEQGKLLRLPCAVGDTVYAIYRVTDSIHNIYDFEIDALRLAVNAVNGNFGKTVFVTREEAETALENMN